MDDATLARVKTRTRAGLIRQLDSNAGLAQLLASYYANYGDWRKLFTSLDEIDKVTADDVQRVARAIFHSGQPHRRRDLPARRSRPMKHALDRWSRGLQPAALCPAAACPAAQAQTAPPAVVQRPQIPAAAAKSRSQSRRIHAAQRHEGLSAGKPRTARWSAASPWSAPAISSIPPTRSASPPSPAR